MTVPRQSHHICDCASLIQSFLSAHTCPVALQGAPYMPVHLARYSDDPIWSFLSSSHRLQQSIVLKVILSGFRCSWLDYGMSTVKSYEGILLISFAGPCCYSGCIAVQHTLHLLTFQQLSYSGFIKFKLELTHSVPPSLSCSSGAE